MGIGELDSTLRLVELTTRELKALLKDCGSKADLTRHDSTKNKEIPSRGRGPERAPRKITTADPKLQLLPTSYVRSSGSDSCSVQSKGCESTAGLFQLHRRLQVAVSAS